MLKRPIYFMVIYFVLVLQWHGIKVRYIVRSLSSIRKLGLGQKNQQRKTGWMECWTEWCWTTTWHSSYKENLQITIGPVIQKVHIDLYINQPISESMTILILCFITCRFLLCSWIIQIVNLYHFSQMYMCSVISYIIIIALAATEGMWMWQLIHELTVLVMSCSGYSTIRCKIANGLPAWEMTENCMIQLGIPVNNHCWCWGGAEKYRLD